MNNSTMMEILMCFIAGMFPVIFTFAITNARMKNEAIEEISAVVTVAEDIHSPSIHSPSIHSPSIHSPSIHSPSIHSPSIHSPSIHSLKSVLEEEKEKTRRLQSVVYQMMGKLYDDERNKQSSEIDYLFGKTPIGENENINPIKEDSVVRVHVLKSCAEENTKAIAELKELVNSDYCNFNEIFMRMHDLKEKVETQEDVIRALEIKNGDLEKRMKDFEARVEAILHK